MKVEFFILLYFLIKLNKHFEDGLVQNKIFTNNVSIANLFHLFSFLFITDRC